MYDRSELPEVREKLQTFLDTFERYSNEIYGKHRQGVLDRLRKDLQRRKPEVTKILLESNDPNTLFGVGSFGQIRNIGLQYLLPTALLGGNNELTFNFADYKAPVQAVLNSTIGMIDTEIASTGESKVPREGMKGTDTIMKDSYVDPARIRGLAAISSQEYDTTKLIKMCEELNIANSNECYMTIAMITRAIIDHVPPLLGCDTFQNVANNYQGARSFKDSMKHLDESMRKISNSILHTVIRNKETLPTFVQVNFSADLDVLFGEIIRVRKKDVR